jgi:hypothetical protein
MKWALLVSFYANRGVYETLRDIPRFDGIQLINTPPPLSGFEENVMFTANDAVASLFPDASPNFTPIVRYVDDLVPAEGEATRLTCFREALLLSRNEVYFVNNQGMLQDHLL